MGHLHVTLRASDPEVRAGSFADRGSCWSPLLLWFALSFRDKGRTPMSFVILQQQVGAMPQPSGDPVVPGDPRKCQGFTLDWPGPADRRHCHAVAQTRAVPGGPGRSSRPGLPPTGLGWSSPTVTGAVVCRGHWYIYQPELQSQDLSLRGKQLSKLILECSPETLQRRPPRKLPCTRPPGPQSSRGRASLKPSRGLGAVG